MLIIVDIDGTLADLTLRYAAHVKPESSENREEFQMWLDKVQDGLAMIADRPIRGMHKLLWALQHYSDQTELVYLTGRSEKYRILTVAWLKLHEFPDGTLYMRDDNDYRKPVLYKEEQVKKLLLGKPENFLAID